MTETSDILLSDIVVNPEGEGFLAFLGFQPLTAFPPFSGLPPAKYYTGGYATTKQEAIDKAIDIVIEHLTKLRTEKPILGIGFLRQWLNEDRITDPTRMVTNEQLETWLITK